MWAYIREWSASFFNLPVLNIPTVGFTEIVDIAIVTFLLYKILQWVRQTRAWALLKGVVLVLIVAAFAYLFNLVTVLWVVQNAFTMGLLAIVVLFQPELRKALEQIGKGIFSPFAKSETETNTSTSIHTVNEIIKAAEGMAASRTGALICLEGTVTLAEHIQSGTAMDAMVSSPLLLNIFVDKTPLHDGAVIIQKNRLAAAACILPLTAEEIGRDLGTRHRAAVGLSEVSDAVVVVVSEETGTISIAEGGKLTRGLNEHQLRKRLSRESGGKPVHRKPKRGLHGRKMRHRGDGHAKKDT